MSLALYIPMANDATDKSGNGRNGVVSGATFQDNTGIKKGSYHYNNTTDYIRALFTYNDASMLTISMWLKPVNGSGNHSIFNVRGQSVTIPFMWTWKGGASYVLYIRTLSIGSVYNLFANTNYFAGLENTWIHLCYSIDCSTGVINLYRNGDFYNTVTYASILPVTGINNYYTYIGAYQGAQSFINGNICEVKIDERIWSHQDVKNEYMLMKGILHN